MFGGNKEACTEPGYRPRNPGSVISGNPGFGPGACLVTNITNCISVFVLFDYVKK